LVSKYLCLLFVTGTNVVFYMSMELLVNREECESTLSISNLANLGICIVLCSVAILLSLLYTSDDYGHEFSSKVTLFGLLLFTESCLRVYHHFAVISES
jgi:hypothetical protein